MGWYDRADARLCFPRRLIDLARNHVALARNLRSCTLIEQIVSSGKALFTHIDITLKWQIKTLGKIAMDDYIIC